jgi:hypothetical protein
MKETFGIEAVPACKHTFQRILKGLGEKAALELYGKICAYMICLMKNILWMQGCGKDSVEVGSLAGKKATAAGWRRNASARKSLAP